ncbi:DUF2065 domain-containing protein [Oceanibacterium hippocampi]|uniref:DUF2065 domain-containing protein n=1 Tax=Oceanibacterium hippocampi TaxID=745714 RepID=A0A1Y5TXE8_9PROT|nr:DUF2065 family protein [Oceanibacterium hippocampi]SLN72440.1 hypothetical protein OCH7691_03476 [Oceanibacterium hippocampi]
MTDFAVALALVLVIEGALYALFPVQMKRMMQTVLALSEQTLRRAGLVSAVVGVAVVWLLRR